MVKQVTTGSPQEHCFCTKNTGGDVVCCRCHKTREEIIRELRDKSFVKYDEVRLKND